MIKKILKISLSLSMLFLINSCCQPTVTTSGNCGFPASVTETYTKTSLVSPPSYAMPYMPPSSIYQSAPVAQPMPMQAPVCQPMQLQAPMCQPQAYASPVCPPQYNSYQGHYQGPYRGQYQEDPCANYAAPIRYNQIGTAHALSNPQYIVVQPNPANQAVNVHSPRVNADDCN